MTELTNTIIRQKWSNQEKNKCHLILHIILTLHKLLLQHGKPAIKVKKYFLISLCITRHISCWIFFWCTNKCVHHPVSQFLSVHLCLQSTSTLWPSAWSPSCPQSRRSLIFSESLTLLQNLIWEWYLGALLSSSSPRTSIHTFSSPRHWAGICSSPNTQHNRCPFS